MFSLIRAIVEQGLGHFFITVKILKIVCSVFTRLDKKLLVLFFDRVCLFNLNIDCRSSTRLPNQHYSQFTAYKSVFFLLESLLQYSFLRGVARCGPFYCLLDAKKNATYQPHARSALCNNVPLAFGLVVTTATSKICWEFKLQYFNMGKLHFVIPSFCSSLPEKTGLGVLLLTVWELLRAPSLDMSFFIHWLNKI